MFLSTVSHLGCPRVAILADMGHLRQQLPGSGELERFRDSMFLAMDQWGDALFELADAMLSSPRRVDSVPSLS